MEELSTIGLCVIFFALVYDLSNGWNDSANAIATVVSTRVLRPLSAVVLGAGLNFLGALYRTEVAKTIGKEIADPSLLTPGTYLAAVIVAPVWIAICTLRGLPISCSHSLMGALLGAVLVATGPVVLGSKGFHKMLFGVFTSPVAGFLGGMLLIVLVFWVCRRLRPATVSRWFGRLQLLSAGMMAFSHGTGDAQKAMGIIYGMLISHGILEKGAGVPMWTRVLCALMMAGGTAWGGWKVIRTLGMRLAHLKPYHGFAAETAGAITILACTRFGIPISTTHAITGSVLGVGAAQGIRAVKWGVGRKIVFAWIVTFPVCIGGSALLYWFFRKLGM